MVSAHRQWHIPNCSTYALARTLHDSALTRYGVDMRQDAIQDGLHKVGKLATHGWRTGISLDGLLKAWRDLPREAKGIDDHSPECSTSYELDFDFWPVSFEQACDIVRRPELGFRVAVIYDAPQPGRLRHCVAALHVAPQGRALQCIDSTTLQEEVVERDRAKKDEAWCFAIRAKIASVDYHRDGRRLEKPCKELSGTFRQNAHKYILDCQIEGRAPWLCQKLEEEVHLILPAEPGHATGHKAAASPAPAHGPSPSYLEVGGAGPFREARYGAIGEVRATMRRDVAALQPWASPNFQPDRPAGAGRGFRPSEGWEGRSLRLPEGAEGRGYLGRAAAGGGGGRDPPRGGYPVVRGGGAPPAPGSGSDRRSLILGLLARHQGGAPLETLRIAKAVVGPDATKSTVNPTLYELQKEGRIRRLGPEPRWTWELIRT